MKAQLKTSTVVFEIVIVEASLKGALTAWLTLRPSFIGRRLEVKGIVVNMIVT
jgi:hypothetical protein